MQKFRQMPRRGPSPSLRKVVRKVYQGFTEIEEKPNENDMNEVEAVDTFPEGKTEEDLKQENPTLVYCAFVDCIWNKPVAGLKKFMTASKNPISKPWAFEDDAYRGVCGRGVIAILKKTKTSASNVKTETPECFTMAKDGRATDHVDFTKMLPQGGSIPDPGGAGRGYV